MVSMRRSSGRSSTSTSSTSGSTATVAALVWMRPCASVAGTRCTRWPPDSKRSRAQAPSPSTAKTTSLKPPISLGETSNSSTFQRRASQYFL